MNAYRDEILSLLLGISGSVDRVDRRVEELRTEVAALREENARLHHDIAVRDAHARIYLEGIYRREGEGADESRRRLFSGIAPADGDMRLCQEANARLMAELDGICKKLGIEYWFAYGTLVAALSRKGFIPWDDDIDICMMRDDIERLRSHLEGNPDFQVTTMYDRWVVCRQMRFSAADPKIPCFIDLSIWDYAVDDSKEHDDALRDMRLELMRRVEEDEGFRYWDEHRYLFAPGSGYCVQAGPVDVDALDPASVEEQVRRIEAMFDAYQQRAYDMGIFCSGETAGALAYGIDNIYDAPWRRILWDRDLLLPTHKAPFEQYEFSVPNRADEVMQICYPGSPYLPDDILGHRHFSRSIFSEPGVREAMERFARDAGR